MHRSFPSNVFVIVLLFSPFFWLVSCDEATVKKVPDSFRTEQILADAVYFPPKKIKGGWRKNTSRAFVTSLGLDYDALQAFARYAVYFPNFPIRNYDYDCHPAVLVIKNGWVVGEWYQREASEAFQQYLSSNGKSFAYVLFGMLQEDGKKGRLSVDNFSAYSKLYDRKWLEEGFPLSDPRKAGITFEQIFQHTSGLMPEETTDGTKVEKGRYHWTTVQDWILGHDRRFPATGRLFFPPGKPGQYSGSLVWGDHLMAYSSVGFAHLGLVFYHITGKYPDKLLWKRLLEPIGFDGVSYHRPERKEYRWLTNGGLRMTARDYARFAYFLLRKGSWKGRQLVPRQWIERVYSSPLYPNLRSNVDGFLDQELPPDTLRIFGSGGNFAYIVPSLDLIFLHTGRTNNALVEEFERKFLEKMRAVLK